MTAPAIVGLYLIALAAFLGGAVFKRVPPVVFPLVLAGLAALAALGLVAPWSQSMRALGGDSGLGNLGVALGGMAAGAVVVTLGRLPRAFRRRDP